MRHALLVIIVNTVTTDFRSGRHACHPHRYGRTDTPAIEASDQTFRLANYSNPFNLETWIPYHLVNPSDGQITIYDARSTIVRRLGTQTPTSELLHSKEVYEMRNLTSNPKSVVSFLIAVLLIYGWQDVIPNKAFAQTGQFVQEMINVDKVFSNFMDDWNLPGGSIAIVKDGRLVYARGFGYADKESRELVKPEHLFRMASISKPITSIAIMKLIDEGVINVDAKVFGHDGILNGPDYNTILDPRVKNITVRHLLQHTSGWGFINSNQDPMFSNKHIAQRMNMKPPVDSVTVIKFMLITQRLNNEPGTHYFYSNFGYCILGRIIESVSGKNYENYVKTELLNPLGIAEMQLGQNFYENRASNEVKYYDFPGGPFS